MFNPFRQPTGREAAAARADHARRMILAEARRRAKDAAEGWAEWLRNEHRPVMDAPNMTEAHVAECIEETLLEMIEPPDPQRAADDAADWDATCAEMAAEAEGDNA